MNDVLIRSKEEEQIVLQESKKKHILKQKVQTVKFLKRIGIDFIDKNKELVPKESKSDN